jgi:hypothetical protein
VPRVVPSQVVEVIDQLFPEARGSRRATVRTGPYLAAIAALTKEILADLLTLTGQDLSDYVVALQLIEEMQQHSLGRQRAFQVLEYREKSTIVLLRDALAKCSDEALKPETTGLLFIGDVDLRQSIRRDISAANQDLVIGEWKGCHCPCWSCDRSPAVVGHQTEFGILGAGDPSSTHGRDASSKTLR